jgi:hypothetical protein
VFTDLAGYTQKTATISREELQALAEAHEKHVLEVFKPYGGQLVKSIGDSYMAVFDSATDGVKACLELVQTTLPGMGMEFRASVATGDVQQLENDYFGNSDYFGEPVNLSARINSITPAKEVWFADRTRRCMTQSEVAWETVGLHTFKGVPGKEEVFRAVAPLQCFIPAELKSVLDTEQCTIIKPNERPKIPKDGMVVLAGFAYGSPELESMLHMLSHLPQTDIWLLVYTIATAHRLEWEERGYRFLIGSPEAFDASVELALEAKKDFDANKTSTLTLDFSSLGDISLEVIGVALPAVPLVNLIGAYSIDLLADGSWGYNKSRALAEIHVTPKDVTLTPFRPGMMINSVGVPTGEEVHLKQNSRFRMHEWVYRYLSHVGGLYKGLIIGSSALSQQFNVKDKVEMGRSPNGNGFELVDRGGTDRIRWIQGPQMEKAKAQGLTLDRTLIGRQHTLLNIVRKDLVVVSPIHNRLPTFVIPKGKSKLERVTKEQVLQFGDILVVGTYVFGLKKMF